MSPLGDAIYAILVQRVGLGSPLITYQELVKQLPSLSPPYDNIARNDERLYKALTEVGASCQERGLPAITALVIRSQERSPGAGYFHLTHPEAGDDPERRTAAWQAELAKLKNARYPVGVRGEAAPKQDSPAKEPRKPKAMGLLRIADSGAKSHVVYSGQVICRQCEATLNVDVERNPSAISAKQPAFMIVEQSGNSDSSPVGHLFIGTILSSPVLYYGAINHCNSEQRVAVFYNRGIRDRSDHLLTLMPSLSGDAASPESSEEVFKLS